MPTRPWLTSRFFFPTAAVLAAALAASPRASAQGCGGFTPGLFDATGGVGWYVVDLEQHDDGAGPALYAAGQFTVASGAPANRVARWDGSAWSAVGGSGADDIVTCLAVFDDGSGPALYAGGYFRSMSGVPCERIAKWDGTTWSPLGAGLDGGASALQVFDDGRGPALFVGGYFDRAGGAPAGRIARWDGSSWSTLGAGVTMGSFGPGQVNSLGVWDDGRGPALYAGGNIAMVGGVRASHVARWDGASWSALGRGLDYWVYALETHDEGRGPVLFAAGAFDAFASPRVARWDGARWSAVGAGFDFTVSSLETYDDGSGARLYACGFFQAADGAPASRIAAWDGVAWSALGGGMTKSVGSAVVFDVEPFDDGTGRALFAGGDFTRAGETAAECVAKWDGREWSALGERGLRGHPRAILEVGGGASRTVVVGGAFTAAGGAPIANVASWNGTSFAPLGAGFDGAVDALAVFDDGTGPALYAGGEFTASGSTAVAHVARWDGAAWRPLGAGLDGAVHALAVFDDGSGGALYAGGAFGLSGGSTSLRGVARWDGASWTPLATGIQGEVFALLAHDDGSGASLYCGGSFMVAGGAFAPAIARWDGAAFRALDVTLVRGGTVRALARMDDGSGPALYLGGDRLVQDSPAVVEWRAGIARSIGFTSASVLSLFAYDSGSGPRLFAGGEFERVNVDFALHLAAFAGGVWTPVGDGVDGDVTAMGVTLLGGQSALLVGGRFASAGRKSASGLARWSDACTACRQGSVNAGRGPITDVLFVNDSTGGPTRTVSLVTHEPVTIFVNGPPAASGRSPFALYLWTERPDDGSWRTLPHGIGVSCMPTPLSPGGGPAPAAIFNNTGKRALGLPSAPSEPAPWIVARFRHGTRRPITFFAQGIVADPGSAAQRRASVTNGVLVVAR